jgi:hypothetical protein
LKAENNWNIDLGRARPDELTEAKKIQEKDLRNMHAQFVQYDRLKAENKQV